MQPSNLNQAPPKNGLSWVKKILKYLLAKHSTITPKTIQLANPTNITELENLNPQPIEYPAASFLGLPAELRLQIYTQLAQSLHVHVDAAYGQSLSGRKKRLCNAPDNTFPQLCTRPEFSGLHPNDAMCYPRSVDSKWEDPFALRATCRLVYHETRGLLDKSEVGFTIENQVSIRFFNSLSRDEKACLTRLTVINANYATTYFDGMHREVAYFACNPNLFPSLRTLAVQSTQPHYKFCVKQPRFAPRFAPEQTWQNVWFVKQLYDAFGGRVTIVLEAWVVVRAGFRENTSNRDEIVVIRGVQWGKKDRLRKGNDVVEIMRMKVTEEEEKAHWKIWWKDEWLGYGRRPPG